MAAPTITLRNPSADDKTVSFTEPTLDFIAGEWWITHSSLPMWKPLSNVRVSYKPVSGASDSSSSPGSSHVKLHDEIIYNQGTKVKTVTGMDTPTGPGAWTWRGAGLLKIASSSWLILGYGGGEDGIQPWIVTFFQKTIFSPMGIDIYSRDKTGLNAELLEAIKKALLEHSDESVRKLAGELFEVTRD